MKNFGLLPEPPRSEKDHILGGLGESADIITNDPWNFWKQSKFNPLNDIQKDKNGVDLYCCVTMSIVNGYERYFEYLMSVDSTIKPILDSLGCITPDGIVKFSDRFITIMSGTDPNAGNSVTAVCDAIWKYGMLGYKFLPWDNKTMTKEEFYDKSKITQELKDQALKIKPYFDLLHAWIGGNVADQNELEEAEKKGVVRVSVDGSGYGSVDSNGYINGFRNYSHSVLHIGGEKSVYNQIHDHYNNQYPKFSPTYPFGNGKLLYVKKKSNSKILTLPEIRVGKDIYYLGKAGTYLNKYVSYGNADIYKSTRGEFNPKNWVQDPLGAGILPDNMALDESGKQISIATVVEGKITN